MLLTWQAPPAVPGVITGYTTCYRIGFGTGSTAASKGWQEVAVPADTQQLIVRDLQRFTAYEFTVAVNTHAGRGRASHPVVVVTGEDAKRLFLAKEPRPPPVEVPTASATSWVRPAQTVAEAAALQSTVEGTIADLTPEGEHLTVNYEVRGVNNTVGRE